MIRSFKNKLNFLRTTPIHPQWLLNRGRKSLESYLAGRGAAEQVLDVGCFDQWPKAHLSDSCFYVGLDYLQTAEQWYHSRPNVYGDGIKLPFMEDCFDTALLLDVVEHIGDTAILMEELHRVIKPGGELIIQVPFLYPLHDEPRDYYRFSRHGLEMLAKRHGFEVVSCHALGQPAETVFLLHNLALSKQYLGWLKSKSPLMLTIVILPVIFFLNNILARSLAYFSQDDFMPFAYQCVFKKVRLNS